MLTRLPFLLSRPACIVRPYADLVWHTHMLRGADYEAESARMRGGSCGALDHDNGEGVPPIAPGWPPLAPF